MLYRYAKTRSGQLIDILTYGNSNREEYGELVCPGCGGELIPVLGHRRERHFRHLRGQPTLCSPESYLHKLGKSVFIEAFGNALAQDKPYFLRRRANVKCDQCDKALGPSNRATDGTELIDLTRLYDRIEEEAYIDGFRADVLLTSSSSDEKLLIEVHVTHACVPEKLASGLRIVELEIANEEDATALLKGIDEFDGRTQLHNFPAAISKPISCPLNCANKSCARRLPRPISRTTKSGREERLSHKALMRRWRRYDEGAQRSIRKSGVVSSNIRHTEQTNLTRDFVRAAHEAGRTVLKSEEGWYQNRKGTFMNEIRQRDESYRALIFFKVEWGEWSGRVENRRTGWSRWLLRSFDPADVRAELYRAIKGDTQSRP